MRRLSIPVIFPHTITLHSTSLRRSFYTADKVRGPPNRLADSDSHAHFQKTSSVKYVETKLYRPTHLAPLAWFAGNALQMKTRHKENKDGMGEKRLKGAGGLKQVTQRRWGEMGLRKETKNGGRCHLRLVSSSFFPFN